MTIFPTTTVADLIASLTGTIADNIVVIVGVVGLAVGIAFVTRWFTKSTRRIKA